ncbi:HNH endonuclease [bacterium]|nr:HNH endonuclease [bacterium]
MSGFDAVVANTDQRWFRHFRGQSNYAAVEVDEVNFWRPFAQQEFRALLPGHPFFFRLKAPIAAIAGFGFFAVEHAVPVPVAWDLFGEKNGTTSPEDFVQRIDKFRSRPGTADRVNAKLSCLVLRDAVFLPESAWVSWQRNEGWSPRVQTYKRYDLTTAAGSVLTRLLRDNHPAAVPELTPVFHLVESDNRVRIGASIVARAGQGTFKLRLLKAYQGRCAVTGEHAVPVLDAAHIQSYLGPSSNHLQNGLLLRTDLHRLYDSGYVTVTPDFRFEVSRRLKDEFDNGQTYYDLAGRELTVPSTANARPSVEALRWHAENVFR